MRSALVASVRILDVDVVCEYSASFATQAPCANEGTRHKSMHDASLPLIVIFAIAFTCEALRATRVTRVSQFRIRYMFSRMLAFGAVLKCRAAQCRLLVLFLKTTLEDRTCMHTLYAHPMYIR